MFVSEQSGVNRFCLAVLYLEAKAPCSLKLFFTSVVDVDARWACCATVMVSFHRRRATN